MVLFADGVVDVHVRQTAQVLQDEGFIPAACRVAVADVQRQGKGGALQQEVKGFQLQKSVKPPQFSTQILMALFPMACSQASRNPLVLRIYSSRKRLYR